jgi:Tfp pilus assembly protein PilF
MMIAALLLPFALMQAEAAPAAQSRFDRCVAAIEADAAAAYEEAMAWAGEARALDAYRCAAMALAGQQRYAEAARRFESLAVTINPEYASGRAELFSQAGNSWLLDRDPEHARSAFTRALATVERWPELTPDLLIDRARAYAMEGDYRAAEQDLNHALDLRAEDSLALRLRASARMHQNAFDLAEADAQRALALAASEDERVGAALMLGHAREAKRTGQPVDEQ